MTPLAVALLSLVGVLIGASLQYVFGRSLDLRKHVQLQKGTAYADYFRAFSAIATMGRNKETLSNLADAKTRVCVYGSARVIKALGDFERSGSTTLNDDSRSLVSQLLTEMRRDAGGLKDTPKMADLQVILFGQK